MMSKLSDKIARDLFALGDEPRRPTSRIEFKYKDVLGHEHAQGGLCESALSTFIERSISETSLPTKDTPLQDNRGEEC